MNPNIFIVTGKVQSGKTTRLFKFVNENKNVDGILSPIVDGERKLYHISTKVIRDLEVEEKSEVTVSVGEYIFLKDSFNWANQNLLASFVNSPEWLIIDEIGKLELSGKGLHSSVLKILDERNKKNTKIVLVIRDYLLKDVLKHYKITEDIFSIME